MDRMHKIGMHVIASETLALIASKDIPHTQLTVYHRYMLRLPSRIAEFNTSTMHFVCSFFFHRGLQRVHERDLLTGEM